MNNQTKIYIVRHAQSVFNSGKYEDDDVTSPLSEKGKEQARKLAEKFKDIDFAAIYSSGLPRTKETAEILKLDRNIEIQPQESLFERSIFVYAKEIKEDVSFLDEELIKNTKGMSDDEKLDYKYKPNMESAREGAMRLINVINQAAKEFEGKNILIVAHGNLMRSFLPMFGFAKYDELPGGGIVNTGYFVLQPDVDSFKLIAEEGINREKDGIRIW